MTKAVDAKSIKSRTGSIYPEPYASQVGRKEKWALGNAFGLDGFGVNLVRLPPDCPSSMRHWHTKEDELIYVLEGEVVLETDEGEQVLVPGMAAGFKAGEPNGHRLVNKSNKDAVYLEVGSRIAGDEAEYPDIDMRVIWNNGRVFVHKDGTPFD